MKGKVWLVGAGPSDAGLLTIKGKEVLEQADVVVYDRLVGDGILSMIPRESKKIDVGKRAGNHTMKQEDINQVLVEEAKKGYRVVRLKGGDPFLFGRGGEEISNCKKEGIPYEIVPGITSAFSVPAYFGIPVTHRDYASSVHIITGHRREGEEDSINYSALAQLDGTLLFLMGVSFLERICKGLIGGGMDKRTPAALLQRGTTSRQKSILSTVGDLFEEIKKHKIETPAILIVGKVCDLSKDFQWFEKLPLWNKKLVITRPRRGESRIAKKLREVGAEVLEAPCVSLHPRITKDQETIFQNLFTYQWIVFTSGAGVELFFEELKKRKLDVRSLYFCKFAVVGSGTAKVLEEHGMYANVIPKEFHGKSLGETLLNHVAPKDKILIPRGSLGGKEILEVLLKGKELDVTDFPLYDTLYEEQGVLDLRERLREGDIDYGVFTSASAVRGFMAWVKEEDLSGLTAVCIGEKTKEEARKYGMKTLVSKEATMDSMVELLLQIEEVN